MFSKECFNLDLPCVSEFLSHNGSGFIMSHKVNKTQGKYTLTVVVTPLPKTVCNVLKITAHYTAFRLQFS